MKKILSVLLTLTMLLSGLTIAAAEEESAVLLSVESSLFGSAYTNAKSTLKSHLNETVTYSSDSVAVFTLTLADGSAVDDALIDTSAATVTLTDGDGYYTYEYTFLATELDGEWTNGTYTYCLEAGDLELDRSVYPQDADPDSGREWSCLGGDGQGNYYFNLTVSGIVYDGVEVPAETFVVHIYIYGYDYTEDAVELYGEAGTQPLEPVFESLSDKLGEAVDAADEPVWTWVGDGDKPVLCDDLEDDFYITWPEGMDASDVTAADVTITLNSAYGDTRVLTADQEYYVSSDAGETQIAITWQNGDYVPVYTTMTIEVAGSVSAEAEYDIASVFAYLLQQGGHGNTADSMVTAYSLYGMTGVTSWEMLLSAPYYVLETTDESGNTLYYTTGANGTAALTDDIDAADMFDGTEEVNPAFIGNTLYVTTVTPKTVEMEVDGETVLFTQNFVDAGTMNMMGFAMLGLEPGYAMPLRNFMATHKWAWQASVATGWTAIAITPEGSRYQLELAAGTVEQFACEVEGVTWSLAGDVDEGTTITQDGLLTIAEDETHESFAVTVRDADGNCGAVTIVVE